MIYINQLGEKELGRGETIEEAFNQAQKIFQDLDLSDIYGYYPGKQHKGAVVWSMEPMPGYNDI